ncbi:MAG TPA: outer membrane beta-barrel protein [Xanthobacteraceae bacterium]|nr:outer membrane beta-barrel protein [Xanthobacteraceae bacterium]
MRSFKITLIAGAMLAAAFTSAQAADLGPIMQATPVQPVQVEPASSGWYLRGDIGVGLQQFDNFNHTQTNQAFVWPSSWQIVQQTFGDTTFFGVGVGYQFNSWLRADATAEYRNTANFKVIGSYNNFCPNGSNCFDVYEGQHTAMVFMANAYVDLGTWFCLTPFVGVGAGMARHSFTGVTDVGYIADGTTGFGYSGADSSEWKFAWALHAGVAYNVSNNLKLEFAYRYINFGNVDTGVIDCTHGGCAQNLGPDAYYTFTNLTSQDFKLGLRWMLVPDQAPPSYPPLMRKG